MRCRTLDSDAQYSLADFFIVRFTFPKSLVAQALSITPSLLSEKNCSAVSPSEWLSTLTCTGVACASDNSANMVKLINSLGIFIRIFGRPNRFVCLVHLVLAYRSNCLFVGEIRETSNDRHPTEAAALVSSFNDVCCILCLGLREPRPPRASWALRLP